MPSIHHRCVAAAVLLASAALGCKSGLQYDDCDATPLTTPWTELEVPVAGGRVCKSTSSSLTAQFLAGTVAELKAKNESALLSKGFTLIECQKELDRHRTKTERSTCRYVAGQKEVIVTLVWTRMKSDAREILSADYGYEDNTGTAWTLKPSIWGSRGDVFSPLPSASHSN